MGQHRGVTAHDLLAEMGRAGVEYAVLVPFMDAPAFDDLLAASRTFPTRFQAVCRIDLSTKSTNDQATEALLNHGFIGARVALSENIASAAETASVLSILDQQGKTLVVHAPEGIGLHARQISDWVNNYPSLRIFVPHLGWPCDANATPTRFWAEGIRALAAQRRVFVGLSALYYFSRMPPPFNDTHHFVQTVLESFGPERCVLAGDYPMTLTRCHYAQVWESLKEAVADDAAFEIMCSATPVALWNCG